MIQTVLKRDGRQVGYNEEKIKAAIRKAMIAAEVNDDEALIQRIADRIGMRGKSQMTVEAIQDMVEIATRAMWHARPAPPTCLRRSSTPKTTTSLAKTPT